MPRPADTGDESAPPGADRPGGDRPPPARSGRPADAGPTADAPTDEELAQVARQLTRAPAEDVIANHAYGLFELAALHLSQQPPQLTKARLAIDAMGLLVDGLGDRLGEHAASLREALTQVRIAFVRISEAAPAGDGAEGAEPDGDGDGASGAEPAAAAPRPHPPDGDLSGHPGPGVA